MSVAGTVTAKQSNMRRGFTFCGHTAGLVCTCDTCGIRTHAGRPRLRADALTTRPKLPRLQYLRQADSSARAAGRARVAQQLHGNCVAAALHLPAAALGGRTIATKLLARATVALVRARTPRRELLLAPALQFMARRVAMGGRVKLQRRQPFKAASAAASPGLAHSLRHLQCKPVWRLL